MLNSQRLKKGCLFTQGGQQPEILAVFAHHHAGMRPESENNAFSIAGTAYIQQPGNNFPVPQVHTVKHPAGYDGIAQPRKLIYMVVYLHGYSRESFIG